MGGSLEDLRSRRTYVAVLAELLATFFLVLVACGSCAAWFKGGVAQPPTTVQISLCFGFSIATLVWCVAHVSGGHLNPAVTLGFMVTRKISIVRGLFYMVAQVLGAIAGAGILDILTPDSVLSNLGTSGPAAGYSAGKTFGVELLITFVLVFTVFSACDGQRSDRGGSIPLTIGLSIAMCHLWAVPYTGSGMNPARVFGPALISGNWKHHWAYWVGPLIGGALAALIYDFLFAVNATPAKLRGFFGRDYDDADYGKNGKTARGEMDDATAELKARA